MYKITLQSLTSFQDFLEENILRDKFEFKYLIKLLDLIFVYRQLRINVSSFIIRKEENWILFIETATQLFMYEDSQNPILRNIFLDSVDLANYTGKEIMGTHNLVGFIVEAQKITYKIIKDRNFLSASALIPIDYIWNIEEASEGELDELISLHQKYYEEEYKNTRNKREEQLSDGISIQINEKNIFIIRNDEKILSFCTIMDSEIGIMFTLQDHRGAGCAQNLLNFCMIRLFENQQQIFVMTDMHNIAANRVCEKCGFKTFYKHSNIEL